MYCSSPPPKEVHQAVVRTGLGKIPTQPATTTHHSSTAYATSPSSQLRCPPLPLRLPRPVSSVQGPRREDGETASIQTLYTHRRGGSPPLPLKTPTTSPSSPHRHLKTSTQPDNIKLNPPPASCLHGSHVSPSRVLPSPIHLRYPRPSLTLPNSQPAPSESESRPLLGIHRILCSAGGSIHVVHTSYVGGDRRPALPPSLLHSPIPPPCPRGGRNRRSGSVSLFGPSGDVTLTHSALGQACPRGAAELPLAVSCSWIQLHRMEILCGETEARPGKAWTLRSTLVHGRPAHSDPILHGAAHPRPWLRHLSSPGN